MAIAESNGRTNQKARTRRAIVDACVELIRQRQPVTMPEVAKAAMVSEATAYRYFPDLASLLAKALAEDWPTPTEALAPVAASNDPVERVAFATRFLLQGVAERQAVVRAMISATIAQPDLSGRARPGIRFGLIECALAPFVDAFEAANPGPAGSAAARSRRGRQRGSVVQPHRPLRSQHRGRHRQRGEDRQNAHRRRLCADQLGPLQSDRPSDPHAMVASFGAAVRCAWLYALQQRGASV